jgi:protein required for attachment to host cells
MSGHVTVVKKDKGEKADNFLLPNAPTYIAACDSAAAHIYLTHNRFGDWAEVKTLRNVDATLRQRDRYTDRPGRVFDSFGKGRHAMAPGETGRHQSTQRFAHEVADYLYRALRAGEFNHLVLISDPTFLGLLRREFTAALRRRICHELPVNPTGFDIDKLRSLFT